MAVRLKMAAATGDFAHRSAGLHLVRDGAAGVAEVAMPAQFDDAVVDGVLLLLEARGLVALPCGDAPGRIVDRLVAAVWLETRAAVAAGASDAVIVRALADAGIILDAVVEPDRAAVIAAIHAGLGEPDRYDATIVRPRGPASPDVATLVERLALAAIAEAYRLVEEAVAGAEEIERAMTAGAGWAAGPFTLAGRRKLSSVLFS